MTEQVDLDALEALAKAATPGPWFASRPGKRYEEGHHVWSKREPEEPDSHDIATYCWGQEEAEFIAAADPSTVLALIAELRQEREHNAYFRSLPTVSVYVRLEAALSRAEETIDRFRTLEPLWHRGMYGCPQDMYGANQIRAILTEYDKQKEGDRG